jgi:cell division transport system permease protein
VRVSVVFSEAARSLRASMSTTVAATLTVLIGMFVLGLTIALGSWVLSWSDHVKKQLLVKVYFCTAGYHDCRNTATLKQEAAVGNFLRTNDRVAKLTYVSSERALTIMRKKQPELTKGLSYNPLPDGFEVIPKKAEYNAQIKREILHSGPGGTKPAGLDEVKDGGETSRRVLRVGSIVELVFLIGVIVLLIASTLLIANTIRLSIFARRRENEVMKLVGATNWFVRGPFMLEGLICGLLGSIAAVFLLLVGKEVLLPEILGHIQDSKDVHALAFELQALSIIGAGLLLGAAGSGLTLHRFLRV